MKQILPSEPTVFTPNPYWFNIEPTGSGVYVYIEKRSVLYVGKTNNLYRRLVGHHVITSRRIRRIIQNRAMLLFNPCTDPYMSKLEAYLIYCYQPDWNAVQPTVVDISNGSSILSEIGNLCK